MGQPNALTKSICSNILLQRLFHPQRDHLHTTTLPGSLLFTSDAKSMYTSIQTEPSLCEISTYFWQEEGKWCRYDNSTKIIGALEIVFHDNIIQFGDTYWKQISGTGMGIASTPPWANIFYALHKQTFLQKWSYHVIFYKWFIHNVTGIWHPHPLPQHDSLLWQSFQQQTRVGITPFSMSCNNMDLTISINCNRLITTLFEKTQSLSLHPPMSSHPPGMIYRLIFGNILQLHCLCSSIK